MITIYITKPITDAKILPDSVLPDEAISNQIFLNGSPGEYRPATFTIHTTEEILGLVISASTLGFIPSSNIDISVVKCWYQAGERINEPHYNKNAKILTPELLLKDDSLVKVEGGENYVKFNTTGEYVWISEVKSLTAAVSPFTSEFPIEDSDILQPVNIPAGTNKQFWVTVKIPSNIAPGTYSGRIDLTTPSGLIGEVVLQLEVLSINLAEPLLTYSIYYHSRLRGGEWTQGTISGKEKSETQMRAELADLLNHGVSQPFVDQNIYSPRLLERILQLRAEAGIVDSTIYHHASNVATWGNDYDALKDYLNGLKSRLAPYGVTELYIYCPDEQEITTETRAQIEAAHEVGVKAFVALGKDKAQRAADILDLVIAAYGLDASLAALYHSYGHKIFSYANPQVGVEKPETYRRNYGLLLWQKDYDGAMDWAYQGACGFIWNDFDHVSYRDHVFGYPTMNGVIDTIQWEGWREGVTDVRYLTTLLNVIEAGKARGVSTSGAEAYLASLKTADLAVTDLDQTRLEMINHILSIQSQLQPTIVAVLETAVVATLLIALAGIITRRL